MQTLSCGRALRRLADQGTNLNLWSEEKEGRKNKPSHKIIFTQSLTFCLTPVPPAGTGGQSRVRAQRRAVHIPPETPVSLFPLRAGSRGANRPSWARGRHAEGTMHTSTPSKAFQRGTRPPQHTCCHTVTPQWGQLPLRAPVPTHPTGKRAPRSPRPQQAEPSQHCHAGHLHQPTRRGQAQHSCEQPQLGQSRQPSQVAALSSTALLMLLGRVCLLPAAGISNSSKNIPPNWIFLLLMA